MSRWRISSAFPRRSGLVVSLPYIVSHHDLCSEKIQPLDGKVGLTGFQSLFLKFFFFTKNKRGSNSILGCPGVVLMSAPQTNGHNRDQIMGGEIAR